MTSPPTASGSSSPSTARSSPPRPTRGELRQLTDGPARDRRCPVLARRQVDRLRLRPERPRGDLTSIAADGAGPAKKVTDLDALKSSFVWSPDSQVDRLHDLRPQALHDRRRRQGPQGAGLLEVRQTSAGPAWSPDGKWIAYSKPDVTRSSDVYLIPADGGEEKKITFDSASEANPQFSADAKKLYFVRREGDVERRCASLVADLLHAAGEARPRTRTRPTQRPDGSPAEPGQEMAPARARPRTVAAQDAEDRLGRPEAADPAGHAGRARSSTTSRPTTAGR